MSAQAKPDWTSLLERLLPDGFVSEWGDPQSGHPRLLPAEQALVQAAVEKRRREFSMGRHCARSALARLGIAELPILAGAQREPIWPEGVVGSLTHTRGFCAAVVGPKRRFLGVGIDAEEDEPLERSIAEAVATDSEVQCLAALDPGIAARLVFSAKEAFYKCQFYATRRWLDFFDIAIALEPNGEFSASLLLDAPPLPKGISARGRWVHEGGLLVTSVWLPSAA